ncbi:MULTISPECIES: formylmethanofuran dehydrogenase subunit B [unclassified Archaeoglobus]|uniref:formylmethanofuran dehydrogenase subunit B n=1 Tax=unclassified Archaeoglobus TaxID=2643606 RepID=UPI0025B81D61|nr:MULTISPECIES: formylmethanofuran dehydrogenase subunit B [unclassified Archaeoglobus]
MSFVCPGCSCLCDDIEIVDGRILHACRRGEEIFEKYKENRAKPMVKGKEVDIDSAIEEATEVLKDSKNTVIYGMDTTTVEAQQLGIELAEKLNAYIDDNSSFCLGEFVEAILRKELPTTTLEDVRDRAYVMVYWGANPFHSLSRHMSRYSYYPRGAKRPRGYEEDRFLVVVDVRRSETAKLAKKNAKFIQVDNDDELVDSFFKVMEGKAAKYAKEAGIILNEMKKSDLNVIFGGLGLKYGLKDLGKFVEMVRKMNEVAPLYFIPAGFHANMRGFNETLFEKTGYVNKYSFKDGKGDVDFAFTSLLQNGKVDTAVIIGTDPVSSLPYDVASKLKEVKTIVIDPRMSPTARVADIIIPSAVSGIEMGGTMVRSDGARIKLEVIEERDVNDIYILKKIEEGL